jgi:hypothetical protein
MSIMQFCGRSASASRQRDTLTSESQKIQTPILGADWAAGGVNSRTVTADFGTYEIAEDGCLLTCWPVSN